RDRAGPYAVGARQGAPDALQVADRWHLLGNVREALERLLDRKQNKLREAAQQLISQPIATAVVPSPAAAEPPPAKPPSGAERRRQSRRQRRLGRYQQVRELHGRGFGIRQIARALRISRRTVRRFLRAEAFPERLARRPLPSKLDPHADYLRRRWQEGCHNAAQLHRELRAQDSRCSYATVQRQLERLGCTQERPPGAAARQPRPAAVQPPSARRVSFWVVKSPPEREAGQQR